DINAEIAGRAQNLDHTAHRAFTVFRVLQQLDVYDHAVELRRIGHSQRLGTDAVDPFSRSGDRQVFRNLDPVVQTVVVRNHQKPVAPHLELANHGRMRPLENLDDFTIRAAACLDARNAHHHTVAVHGIAGGIGRDVNVSGNAFDRLVCDQETVAIAVHGEPAYGE